MYVNGADSGNLTPSPVGTAGNATAASAGAKNREPPSPRRPLQDIAEFSAEGLNAAAQNQKNKANSPAGLPSVQRQLTPEQQREIEKLQSRDREVRGHEQAHITAGGVYVREGANYRYATGPDGKRYATGGDVRIDMSSAGSPEGTIRKMQVIERAAIAPAQPSPQDRALYANAVKRENAARQDLTEENTEETVG